MNFFGNSYYDNSFEQTYRCYSCSVIDKPQLESGDKIIMPPSALDRIAYLDIDYPMLFELRNDSANRVSHCGVLEFSSEEGVIYMPNWMMANMHLQEGDLVRVENASLPKGTYVKMQPHTTDFLEISNPKATLETVLRKFSCLTTGDSIMVAYNNKEYFIDIVESKPANAISIIETDCEVDFAPPLDYKEPEKPLPLNKAPAKGEEIPPEEPKFNTFGGVGRRLDGKLITTQPSQAEEAPPEEPKFNAFGGVGRRLDEKLVTAQPSKAADSSSSLSSGSKDKPQPSAASALEASTRRTQGKLVFGSNVNRGEKNKKEAPKETKQEQPEKKEEPKFAVFSGKKYSLKG